LLNWNIDYEYRTTVVKWMHTIEDIKSMAKYIKWAKNYYLQNYVAWNTLDPNFEWEKFNEIELEDMKEAAEEFVEHCGLRK
jgi:pyruvate formate lyase activating enzyme